MTEELIDKAGQTAELIDKEKKYSAQIYKTLPVVITGGSGCYLYDIEGNGYYDFLSGYSAVNQGHVHPKILEAFVKQAEKVTLTSRAFYTDQFPLFAEYVTQLFGYEKVLMMNTGAEAVETAIKIGRKWGYKAKNIPVNSGLLVVADGCFHGRTTAAISLSTDPVCYEDFGPYLPGIIHIPYNDLNAFKEVCEINGPHIYGFLVESIQGEAGVIIPDEGYLKKCFDLCNTHQILMMVDEIQTMSRTGKLLCCQWDNIHPDVVILGKALSGGMMPISCVLTDDSVMKYMTEGTHGSTWGGNPLASATAMAALKVIVDENLCANAVDRGQQLLSFLLLLKMNFPNIIKDVRGKGLLCALELHDDAWDFCLALKDNGLLARPTHGNIVRLSPPLIITDVQLEEACTLIYNTLVGKPCA